jgi:hypothetical protein
VSYVTGIPLGEFYIISNSLHIYEDMSSRVQRITDRERFDVYDYVEASSLREKGTLEEYDGMINVALHYIQRIRDRNHFDEEAGSTIWLQSDMVSDLAISSLAFVYSTARPDAALNAAISLTDKAFTVGVLEWLIRAKGPTPEALALAKEYPEPVFRYLTGK